MTAPSATRSASDVASRLRFSVMRLARKLRRQLGAEVDISPSQLAALSTIDRGGPLTIGALSEAEQVRPPTMTRIVAALVDKGLVEREGDQNDRRVSWVLATPHGRQLLKQSRRRGNEYLTRRLGALAPEEVDVLERASEILERLADGES
jgi:DNA-binding MarR family transcriptional regulator